MSDKQSVVEKGIEISNCDEESSKEIHGLDGLIENSNPYSISSDNQPSLNTTKDEKAPYETDLRNMKQITAGESDMEIEATFIENSSKIINQSFVEKKELMETSSNKNSNKSDQWNTIRSEDPKNMDFLTSINETCFDKAEEFKMPNNTTEETDVCLKNCHENQRKNVSDTRIPENFSSGKIPSALESDAHKVADDLIKEILVKITSSTQKDIIEPNRADDNVKDYNLLSNLKEESSLLPNEPKLELEQIVNRTHQEIIRSQPITKASPKIELRCGTNQEYLNIEENVKTEYVTDGLTNNEHSTDFTTNQSSTPINITEENQLVSRVSLLRLKKLSSQPRSSVCSSCSLEISTKSSGLTWETMIFCNIKCIENFQKVLHRCKECQKSVDDVLRGKFCVRFGSSLEQFCSSVCLDSFRKEVVVCCNCQILLKKSESEIIQLHDKNQPLFACSRKCQLKFNISIGKEEELPELEECQECSNVGDVLPVIRLDGDKLIKLCSLDCLVDFKRRRKLDFSPCECCGLFINTTDFLPETFVHEIGALKLLCGAPCRNFYISQKRKIRACITCGLMKFNHDLIEEESKKKRVNQFCSVFCYESQTLPLDEKSVASVEKNLYFLPCDSPITKAIRRHSNVAVSTSLNQNEMLNKGIIVKPMMSTKGITCRPHPVFKETQTDEPAPPGLVPIGVPMYVPFPFPLYHRPYPFPVPVPIPIPVPILVPTTRNSIRGITKQIRKIRAKIPSDPFEAEMLDLAGSLLEKDPDSDDSLDEGSVVSENDLCSNDFEDPTNKAESTRECQPLMDLEGDIKGSKVVPKQIEHIVETSPPPLTDNLNRPVQTSLQLQQQRPPQVLQQPRTQQNKRKHFQRNDGNDEEEENTPWRQKAARTKTSTAKEVRKNIPTRDPVLINSGMKVVEEPPDLKNHLKYTYGVNAWKHWVVGKNAELERRRAEGRYIKPFETDILKLRADELNYTLCMFVQEARKPNGEKYAPDSMLYLTLGIQEYLFENGRIDKIFMDFYYEPFTTALHEVMNGYKLPRTELGEIVTRIEEEDLWESKQLGVHSPQVLLNTLVYFNTKYFKLKSADDHIRLAFPHIVKHWKKTNLSPISKPSNQNMNCQVRSAVLRYNQPPNKVGRPDERRIYEQHQNHENPLRCPVKLYEFYLSKCSETMKSANDVFYLQPERSCIPESPVWYTHNSVSKFHLEKMLQRILVVKEIQEYILSEPQ